MAATNSFEDSHYCWSLIMKHLSISHLLFGIKRSFVITLIL